MVYCTAEHWYASSNHLQFCHVCIAPALTLLSSVARQEQQEEVSADSGGAGSAESRQEEQEETI